MAIPEALEEAPQQGEEVARDEAQVDAHPRRSRISMLSSMHS